MALSPRDTLQDPQYIWQFFGTNPYNTKPQIPFEELVDGFRESFTQDTFQVTRKFRVLWEDRWMFIRHMFGFPYLTGNNPSGSFPDTQLRRVIPDIYWGVLKRDTFAQRGLSNAFVLCSEVVSIDGAGRQTMEPINTVYGPTRTPGYDYAFITLKYTTLPYTVISDEEMIAQDGVVDEATLRRYIAKIPQPTAEFLTLPRGAYYWVDTPTAPANQRVPVDSTNGRLVPSKELTYTWHEVPGVPGESETMIGKVNDATFDGYPPGTVLLLGALPKMTRSILGTRVFDIEYKFRYFEPEALKGHNYFLRYFGSEAEPSYTLITHNGDPTGRTIFPAADFRKLFRPPFKQYLND